MKHYPKESTYVEVNTSEWEVTGVILTALFLGGGALLVAWGIWNLLTADATQSAFATAIRYIGYGLAALLVLLGLGGFAYGASFFVKSTAPLKLSEGVRDHGGMFRTDGIVVVLPKNFHKLPPEAQRNIVAALIESGQTDFGRLPNSAPLVDRGDRRKDAPRTDY